MPLAIQAAAGIIDYLRATQKRSLGLLNRLSTYSLGSYMALDAQTRRNLELFRNAMTGEVEGSLLSVIDLTRSPLGGRLLRQWLGQPLLDLETLALRQDAVEDFHGDALMRGKVIKLVGQVADVERLTVRIVRGVANPKEVVTLKRSLALVPQLVEAIQTGQRKATWLIEDVPDCADITALVAQALVDEPLSSVGEGGVVRPGFSPELDQVREASTNAREFIAGLEREEKRRTGIKSLRVGYNKVFGYYIEVSRSHVTQVPEGYIRKQTLVNGERYVTPQLKEYESLILNAQESMERLETSIFRQVCSQISDASERVLRVASVAAQIDLFSSLAEAASRFDYTRPALTDTDELAILNGRHPVVERVVAEGSFVANDTHLSRDDQQIMVLTGPNMSGKSTYLRQVALIVLLAQIGSFVPADSARIGLVDRIFTRVGLQDDLSTGRSTFMVEMVETAGILNNTTPRSLVVLDEIGRGTSTYDGMSIAQAVVEYIHNDPRVLSRTLFATHYHELVELANVLPRIVNYNVAVAEEEGKVIFLHKVVPGGADKSYGIHVAQLAGLPRPVINRAQEVLVELERSNHGNNCHPRDQSSAHGAAAPLPAPPELFDELLELDIPSMTPLEAINHLYQLQQKAKENSA